MTAALTRRAESDALGPLLVRSAANARQLAQLNRLIVEATFARNSLQRRLPIEPETEVALLRAIYDWTEVEGVHELAEETRREHGLDENLELEPRLRCHKDAPGYAAAETPAVARRIAL